MLGRLSALLHEVRLNLRGEWLRHRERSALRRFGEDVARRGFGGSEAHARAHARLMAEIADGERRSAALAAERRGSMEVDRADLRTVVAWVRPAVVIRGLCTRVILRHRESLERRALLPRFEALGVLAMAVAESSGRTGTQSGLEREVAALREALAATVAERDRRGAAFGGRALPAWTGRAGAEAAGFGRAVLAQLRPHFIPKAPALAGLTVGWWIANTYTDSHLRSVFRSVGIGSGGTRVVSSSTYEAMSFWLPLLAAALCAYVGEQIGAFYRGREIEGRVRAKIDG